MSRVENRIIALCRRFPSCRFGLLGLAGGVVAVLVPAAPASAAGNEQVTLRHQINPGVVTVYHLRIDTVRRQPDQPAGHPRQETQNGKLTRVIFRENQPQAAKCAQMLELEPGSVLDEVETPTTGVGDILSSPALQNLAITTLPARVQLSVASINAKQASFITPAQTAWSQAMLSTVVQVTDWPDEAVSVDDNWEQTFQIGSIKGKQRYHLDAIKKVGSDRHVTLTVITETAPTSLSLAGQLLSAKSTVVWSDEDQEAISLDGLVVYRQSVLAQDREVTIRITLSRSRRELMSPGKRAAERKALVCLTGVLADYRQKDYESALRALIRFKKRWPLGIFRPLAEYLDQRITNEHISLKPLPTDQLIQTLVALLTLWDQAQDENDLDVLQRCRLSLAHLAKINRPEMVRLLDNESTQLRALGCFALAFGSTPADLARIQVACGDTDVCVRRTAMYALAIRASPHTDMETLLAGTSDADQAVRRRACEAIGACVRADAEALPAARTALLERLSDESSEVILSAAHALKRIGTPADLEKVKQVAENTASEKLREALDRIVNTNR